MITHAIVMAQKDSLMVSLFRNMYKFTVFFKGFRLFMDISARALAWKCNYAPNTVELFWQHAKAESGLWKLVRTTRWSWPILATL